MRVNQISLLPTITTLLAAFAGHSVACADFAGPPADAQSIVDASDIALENAMFARSAIERYTPRVQMCYPASAKGDPSVVNGFLPPTMLRPIDPERYWTDSTVWVGNIGLGPSARAAPANFTYSFPADGTSWGNPGNSPTGPNTLNANLTGTFGGLNLDAGREYIRAALASWRRYTGLTYQEVADDNLAFTTSTLRSASRGDIRIGGLSFPGETFLAYNLFPQSGGDMVINNIYFTPADFRNSANNYRYFRDVIAHEHGHGIGMIHSVPCNETKLMEPFATPAFDMVQMDDRRGAMRNYGDRFAGNNSSATARNFGDLTTPIAKSIIERDLSTNGATGANATDLDWFRFTLSSPQDIVITVDPTGGNYTAGQQSSECSGTTFAINAENAGNLTIALFLSDGTTLQQAVVNGGGAGVTENLTANALPAGTYFVRVEDVGPNASNNQIVQVYDLTIRMGAAFAPPSAIAGIHKRIGANLRCFYYGDLNSSATETGAVITQYDWDRDGDGVFEVINSAATNRMYPSNGVYNATLRVTDSNGMQDTDTITTTVFGATTTVTNCSPNNGNVNTVVPITITGTNFKNVTAAHVSISGTGVTITGTAVPDSLGTTITGLSLNIAPGAPTGARNITVNNSDGNATGNNLFTVNNPPPPECPGDTNGDNLVNSADLSVLLAQFGTSVPVGTGADFNDDGLVNSADLSVLLGSFGTSC